ncbi:hypothetical protein LJ656_33240 [Paraburkholderia sp. MMS20-SJTR3]|uniref:Uncharacterized protein n=1 Tax=Paraburkholderia sejongensis TaxID=2886946 RepID=A0ABS8K5M8_9BURK|nr:hypothetical protein [Paraburkholderia sp. MMS20-SJTR3]MCC8397430.1 hypothetical protein [Paraburkholderia sp. MMS20-SJTR3]
MTQLDTTLWQTIDTLVEQIPFTKAKVESVLMTQLAEKDASRRAIPNTAFEFYVGGPIGLLDGIVIGNVDLRIRREPGHPGFLVLNQFSGACISLATVRAHYGNLKMTDYPRGRSAYETAAFSAILPWGKLSFGFLERNLGCLEGISFAPHLMEAGGTTK